MARLAGRNTPNTSRPMSDQATGRHFQVKGKRTKYQRYDEAPPYDGSVFWYMNDKEGIWRAFRNSDVKEIT